MSDSLIPSFLVSDMSESLRSLTKNERCEQIAQVAHQKWANEQISHFFERIAHSLMGNLRFAQKIDEQIPSPDIFTIWYVVPIYFNVVITINSRAVFVVFAVLK